MRERFREAVKKLFGLEVGEPALGFPPSPAMGEISITACFDLARQLRQPPRGIAQRVVSELLPIVGVERASIAGPGYINLYLDRAALASALFAQRARGEASIPPSVAGKVLVEHTSINPNKAAHIGHLRNAVLGDTLARLLRFQGRAVEVQNYIDNTGVQVADVVVGLVDLEKKSLDEVRLLAERRSDPRFDYCCWDLYARVFREYESEPTLLARRSETLKAIEEGHGELARIADVVSTAISRLHLETMLRVNIRYDLLVEESEILRLQFWHYAFERMKASGAIRFETAGKNAGCWVMALEASRAGEEENEPGTEEDVKIIVRSNGTVTYVGKDIAYHLWKFDLLGRDFQYARFHRYADGHEVWRTSSKPDAGAPAFGHGTTAFAVIDARQSYLQDVVRRAFITLGYAAQAENMHHFAYEVVGLAPQSLAEMEGAGSGARAGMVEMSGRMGLGVKADDLINALERQALQEVQSREMTSDPREQERTARMIGVAALRYFLLKYTRRTRIAFDFKEALAFEGETGPYLQYTVVRARNILRKFHEAHPESDPEDAAALRPEALRPFLNDDGHPAFWELAFLCAQLELAVDQALATEEPAAVAKFAFKLAQAFNNFYHHYPILPEPDAARQAFMLFLVRLTAQTLEQALELLGIETPERM